MIVRAAHVSREPLDAHDVWPRLARIAEEHGLLVRPRRVPDPLDVSRYLEIRGGTIDLRRTCPWREQHHREQNEPGPSEDAGHVISLSACSASERRDNGRDNVCAVRPSERPSVS